MKKRKITLAVAFVFLISAVFASSTGQRIYTIDDPIYQDIYNLYIDTGKSPLFSSGPWSQQELDKAVSAIDRSTLSDSGKTLYDNIVTRLNSPDSLETGDDFKFALDMDTALESYTHTNTSFNNYLNYTIKGTERELSIGRDNWNQDFTSQKPLLSAGIRFSYSDYIYIYTKGLLGIPYTTKSEFGSKYFGMNINKDFLTDMVMDMNMPYQAYVSLGSSWFNLLLGRERIRWGEGETGNLLLGGNFPYDNTLRLTAFSNKLKYTFLTNFYLHPQNYYINDQGLPISGIYMFMAHRLEWRIAEKFNLHLTEAIMYQSEDNYIDLSILNPAMFFHDYYIAGNANSIISLEMNYTPIKHLTLYFQGVVDEFNTGTGTSPNALGFLSGMKYITTFSNGHTSKTVFEAAYTDPYLYLRKAYEGASFPLNFSASFREFSNNDGLINHIRPLGYKYGNDSIVIALKQEFRKSYEYAAVLSLTYIADGSLNILSDNDGGTATLLSPTSNKNGRDAVSHRFVISVSGEYYPLPKLKLYSSLDYLYLINPDNRKDNANTNDLQLTIGISYKVL